MLTGISAILLLGMFSGWISKKLKLPALFGMILVGIAAGPECLGIIDEAVLNISADIRRVALIIVLTRAGLSLDINELKKAGRPAFLMCFVPATLEICGVVVLAPLIFGKSFTVIEAALTGAVIAAVSPAVVVPRMIKLINENYGTDKQIPQIILAGASADDVFVIVMFTSFLSVLKGGNAEITDFIQIPTSILLGILAGVGTGLLLLYFFRRTNISDELKTIVVLSVSFLLMTLQDFSENYIKISGLIGIMVLGMTFFHKNKELALTLSNKYNKLWAAAEIMLFVLVGTEVRLNSIYEYGISAVIVVSGAMIFRMAGVFISFMRTNLSIKERLFCMMAYTPKATVQAAICAVPLAEGLECGNIILSAGVIAILLTAPLGALMIDRTYKKLLS